MSATPALPDFDKPPVVETALGVDFDPIPGWGIPHYGLFWQTVRAEYPKFQVLPPLVRAMDFESAARPTGLPMLELLAQPPVRCWFESPTSERLLQLQHDKFFHNWRRLPLDTAYPRYPSLRPVFESEWERFRNFLRREKLPQPAVRASEVTYVNHFEKGQEWDSFADVAGITPLWRGGASDQFLPPPDAGSLSARFPISANGYLHVSLQHALRMMDAKEVLQMTITARTRLASSNPEDVLASLDFAREQVVRAFVSLTTPEMHRRWGRGN